MNAAQPKRRKQVKPDTGMKKPLIYSAALHVGVLVLTIIGLPHFVKPVEEREMAITVELADLAAMSETNVVAPPQESEKPEPAPPKPVEPKPKPPEPKPAEPEPEPAPDLLTPQKPEVEEVPEPQKEEPKEEELAEIKNPPKPTNKPKPPKPKPKEEKPKEEEKPQDQQKDFSKLLADLTPNEEPDPKPVNTPPTETESQGQVSQIARFGENFTRSEEDDLNRGVAPCWNVNAGGKYAEDLVVSLRVTVNPDMTVQQVQVIDQGRYNSDAHFRAAADTARRALLNPTCRTLRLPAEKYEMWKVFQYDFDPSMML